MELVSHALHLGGKIVLAVGLESLFQLILKLFELCQGRLGGGQGCSGFFAGFRICDSR